MINHAYAKGGERIEVFDVVVDRYGRVYRLDHKYSITSAWLNENMMGVTNGITVVGENKFYITRYMAKHDVHGG